MSARTHFWPESLINSAKQHLRRPIAVLEAPKDFFVIALKFILLILLDLMEYFLMWITFVQARVSL